MKRTLIIFLLVFISMQFIQVNKTNAKVETNMEIVAPLEIKQIFKTSCYDCHSNEVIWPWYSNIAPMSWIIKSHVKNGVKALNFSTWNEYNDEDKKSKLKKIYRVVYKAMPLASYISFHEDASLSKKQIKEIRDWTGVKK